jgi:hypothetical protein
VAILPHELPHKKRLDYIDRIFIRHDAIKIAAQALQHLTFAPNRRREGSIGYIRGYSRCGKSETLKRHIEELTGTQVGKGLQQLIEGKGQLIVYLELSAGETPLGVATRWLRLFEDLRVSTRGRRYETPLRERDAIQRAIDISNDNDVTLLALDEYQNLFRSGSPAAIDSAGSMLITLQNAARFPIGITGSPLLEELFSRHEAVKERAGPRVLLKPLPFSGRKERLEFAGVIKKFEEMLPFLQKPGLSTPDWLQPTFFTTRGRLGRLTLLTRVATDLAFADCAGGIMPSALSVEHLNRAFDLLHGDDPTMKGVNPWVENFQLPDIPLSVEVSTRISLNDRKPRKGGALYDD